MKAKSARFKVPINSRSDASLASTGTFAEETSPANCPTPRIDTAKALPIAYAVWVLLLFTGLLLIFADIVNPIGLI